VTAAACPPRPVASSGSSAPHGLIKKIPRTHRYRLTAKGLLLTAALQATRRANIKDLLKVA
jgi:hypothetical protein